MCKGLRCATRLMLIFAVLGSLSLITAPSSPANSPYLSALSDLTVGSLLAAPRDCFKQCLGNKCKPTPQVINCVKSGNTCFSAPCKL